MFSRRNEFCLHGELLWISFHYYRSHVKLATLTYVFWSRSSNSRTKPIDILFSLPSRFGWKLIKYGRTLTISRNALHSRSLLTCKTCWPTYFVVSIEAQTYPMYRQNQPKRQHVWHDLTRSDPFLLDFSFRPFDVLTKDWSIVT